MDMSAKGGRPTKEACGLATGMGKGGLGPGCQAPPRGPGHGEERRSPCSKCSPARRERQRGASAPRALPESSSLRLPLENQIKSLQPQLLFLASLINI